MLFEIRCQLMDRIVSTSVKVTFFSKQLNLQLQWEPDKFLSDVKSYTRYYVRYKNKNGAFNHSG